MRSTPRSATPASAPRSTGASCRCARELKNGDQVEIITSKAQTPSPTWESFVVTGKAKARIRRFVRVKQREQYIQLGREIAARRRSARRATILRDKAIEGVAKNFQLPHRRRSVRRGRRRQHDGASDVLHAVFPGSKKTGWRQRMALARARRKGKKKPVAIKGPDPRHGGAFRRLLPSAAGRPHRRHPAPPARA